MTGDDAAGDDAAGDDAAGDDAAGDDAVADDVAATVVRALWDDIACRDWVALRSRLAEDLVTDWPATGERFRGADTFVRLQSEYPEGWSIRVLRVVAAGADGLGADVGGADVAGGARRRQVVSEVEVPHTGVGIFRVASFAEVDVDRAVVTRLTEYWLGPGVQDPPAWRAGLAEALPDAMGRAVAPSSP